MKASVTLAGLAGIALFMGAAVAQEQQLTGTGQFCIKSATGPVKCDYQTNAQCQQARPQNSSDQCLSRTQLEGTVGGAASSDKSEGTGLPGDQRD
jgi:hypothetical protein